MDSHKRIALSLEFKSKEQKPARGGMGKNSLVKVNYHFGGKRDMNKRIQKITAYAPE